MEGFDGVLTKTIEFEHFVINVKYNPYIDEWHFDLGNQVFKFEGTVGKMVYEMLSVMKWSEEADVSRGGGK